MRGLHAPHAVRDLRQGLSDVVHAAWVVAEAARVLRALARPEPPLRLRAGREPGVQAGREGQRARLRPRPRPLGLRPDGGRPLRGTGDEGPPERQDLSLPHS